MAAKTPNEQGGAMVVPSQPGQTTIAKTNPRMKFELISEADFVVPEAFETLLTEGFETQRHVKLQEGKMIRGIYRGMEDGELSARSQTGEIPKVKWVFVQTEPSVTVRMLGAYNMVTQLERVPLGSDVVIGRGSDYVLPNNFRCTDYFVLHKPPLNKETGAAGQVLEASAIKQ